MRLHEQNYMNMFTLVKIRSMQKNRYGILK